MIILFIREPPTLEPLLDVEYELLLVALMTGLHLAESEIAPIIPLRIWALYRQRFLRLHLRQLEQKVTAAHLPVRCLSSCFVNLLDDRLVDSSNDQQSQEHKSSSSSLPHDVTIGLTIGVVGALVLGAFGTLLFVRKKQKDRIYRTEYVNKYPVDPLREAHYPAETVVRSCSWHGTPL